MEVCRGGEVKTLKSIRDFFCFFENVRRNLTAWKFFQIGFQRFEPLPYERKLVENKICIPSSLHLFKTRQLRIVYIYFSP